MTVLSVDMIIVQLIVGGLAAAVGIVAFMMTFVARAAGQSVMFDMYRAFTVMAMLFMADCIAAALLPGFAEDDRSRMMLWMSFLISMLFFLFARLRHYRGKVHPMKSCDEKDVE